MEVLFRLVLSIYGSMGRESRTFYNRLAKKIAEKRELHQLIVTNWIRIKIYFTYILKSALLYLRGSRSISRNACLVGDNTGAAHEVGKN